MPKENRRFPGVERLEPRVTLSVVPALRNRTRHEVSQPHTAAVDQAAAASTPPQGSDDAEAPGEGDAPLHNGGTVHAASFSGYTLESHLDGHPTDGQGPTMTAGPLAMADNHDPSHFAVSLAPLPSLS